MSLDDTARTLWQTKRPPLALLVTGRLMQMLAAGLPEADRERFDALASAMDSWWPRRERKPRDIYDNEFAECMACEPPRLVQPALQAANVLMAALLRAAPLSLPRDSFYDIREEGFIQLIRKAGKASKLPLAQMEARIKAFLEYKKSSWPELIARADRMSWAGGVSWGKLDKRIRSLAVLADLGAVASWVTISDQRALRLELDGVVRTTVLTSDELEALVTIIPTVAVEAG